MSACYAPHLGLKSAAILLLTALLVATGCGNGEAGGLTGDLRYIRSGGLAGVQDRLVIRPDGRTTLTKRGQHVQEFELSGEEIEALGEALDRANLAAIPSDSKSGKPVPDSFSYVVSYEGKEVRTDDPSIPSDLRPLIAHLNRIVAAHRTR